jgi:nucleotide-binding universal stress UspA family protein
MAVDRSRRNTMTRLKTILAVSDFSEAANNAVRRAALVAAGHDARIVLLGVVAARGFAPWSDWFATPADIELKVSQARTMLGRLAAEITARHDSDVTVDVRVGDALEQIHRATDHADLVVIGSRSGKPLRDFVAGTPAERLVRIIRRPVLVVKQPARDAYRRLLVALDIEEPSSGAMHMAAALRGQGVVHLFHALNGLTETRLRSFGLSDELIRSLRARDRAHGEDRLREMMIRMGHDDVTASVGLGPPCAATVRKQQDLPADLVIVGKQRQSAFCSFLLGSTAQRVLTEASSDVLVVPRMESSARNAANRAFGVSPGERRRRRRRAGVAAAT